MWLSLWPYNAFCCSKSWKVKIKNANSCTNDLWHLKQYNNSIQNTRTQGVHHYKMDGLTASSYPNIPKPFCIGTEGSQRKYLPHSTPIITLCKPQNNHEQSILYCVENMGSTPYHFVIYIRTSAKIQQPLLHTWEDKGNHRKLTNPGVCSKFPRFKCIHIQPNHTKPFCSAWKSLSIQSTIL